jgi:hypothetical protein
MIKQDGLEWVCTKCKERFGRVENAIWHDFKKHPQTVEAKKR